MLANCVVLASLASVATPVGCLMSGHLLDRFGRKAGLLIIALPLVIGWLLIGIKPTLMQVSDFLPVFLVLEHWNASLIEKYNFFILYFRVFSIYILDDHFIISLKNRDNINFVRASIVSICALINMWPISFKLSLERPLRFKLQW